jgi:hypothetical protein
MPGKSPAVANERPKHRNHGRVKFMPLTRDELDGRRMRRNCSTRLHHQSLKTSVVAITSARLRRIVLENLSARMLSGEKIDPAARAMAVSALVRTDAGIGLQLVAREVQSLQNYLAPRLYRQPYRIL